MESSYNVVGAGDKSGLGRESVTELELAYPGRFAGVVMGLAAKLELGTLLNEFYEQKRQFIPIEHPEISADIAAVRKGKTSGGKLTFVEVKNEYLPDSHCDVCWSNSLALYAGKTCESGGPCFMAPAEPPDTESDAANEWPGYEPAKWEY